MKESDPASLQPSIVNRQSSIPSPDLLRQELQRIPRLLLIRLRSLGDSILSLPLLESLHGGTTSMIFTLASGARLRIGQKNYRNVWAYNAQLPPSNEVWNRKDLHTV